jgi:gluconate 2-dehydrogenase gamma chain
MNDDSGLSRRSFLQSAAALGSSALLRLGAPAIAGITQAACSARDSESTFAILDDEVAADLAAIAARILPTTDTPGATEAGVIHFFDQALAGEMQGQLGFLLQELGALNIANGQRFATLDEGAQDQALRTIDTGGFFQQLRTMTLFAFFAMGKYGGNKDNVGWDLLGFDGHHGAWTYPFGYYDAEVHGGDFNGN